MPVSLAYLLVVLIWATAPLAIQWSAVETGFSFAAASRMLLAMVFALGLLRLLGIGMPLHRRALLSYLCAGLGLFAAMYLVYWAALRVESGLMSVIFGLSPLVASLLAWLWLPASPLSLWRLAGMLLGVLGLAAVFLGDGLILRPGMALGVAALLVAVLAHTASLVGLKRLDDDSHPLATTAGALSVAAPLFVLAWLGEGAPWPAAISWRGGLSIIYMGLFGSVLGFALYYLIVRRLAAASVAMVTVITPVLALLVGRVFNGEVLPALVWVGAGLISTGLLLHQLGPALSLRK